MKTTSIPIITIAIQWMLISLDEFAWRQLDMVCRSSWSSTLLPLPKKKLMVFGENFYMRCFFNMDISSQDPPVLFFLIALHFLSQLDRYRHPSASEIKDHPLYVSWSFESRSRKRETEIKLGKTSFELIMQEQ